MKLLIFGLAGLWALQTVRAATPTPSDPQLASMPVRVAFNKTFKYPPTPTNPNATEADKKRETFLATYVQVIDKLEFAKDGETKKEIAHFTNGKQKEIWLSGEFTFVTDTTNPNAIMALSAAMVNDPRVIKDLVFPIFDEVSWVDKSNFQGEEERDGIKCYVYKSGNMMAWLDQATRLPVFFQSPKVQTSYSYQPGETLTLPDKFVKKLDETRRAWAGAR